MTSEAPSSHPEHERFGLDVRSSPLGFFVGGLGTLMSNEDFYTYIDIYEDFYTYIDIYLTQHCDFVQVRILSPTLQMRKLSV